MSHQNAEDNGPVKPGKGIVGIAWYRRDQWSLLLETATDRADLEKTYDEWLANMQHVKADIVSQGVKVVKVPIDLEDLLA